MKSSNQAKEMLRVTLPARCEQHFSFLKLSGYLIMKCSHWVVCPCSIFSITEHHLI